MKSLATTASPAVSPASLSSVSINAQALIFSKDYPISQQYYDKLERLIQECPLENFSEIVKSHKEKVLAARFSKPPEEVFKNSLATVASAIILKDNQYITPEQITDFDLRKLEILKSEHGFDYWKDLKIRYSSNVEFKSDLTHRSSTIRLDYDKPFLLYISEKSGDFSNFQFQTIKAFIESTQPHILQISYGIRSPNSHGQFEDKNLLHVLLERELSPFKKELATILFANKVLGSFKVFSHHQEWHAPNSGRYNSVLWYAYHDCLHSAVTSGIKDNVLFALENGAKLHSKQNSYGANAFALSASLINKGKDYREIANILLSASASLEDRKGYINSANTTSSDEVLPIGYFANNGDLKTVVELAALGAGAPIYETKTFRGSDPIELAGYTASNGTYHPVVHSRKSWCEIIAFEIGTDSLPYIKQAVFNLEFAGRYYTAGQSIFDQALKFLIEKGALEKDKIPNPKDSNFLNFVFSLKAAALEAKALDPSFLVKSASFSEQFADIVKAAAVSTNNFEKIYKEVA